MHVPCGRVYHKIGIWWKKSTHTSGKKWLPISQALPIRWISLHFRMLWNPYISHIIKYTIGCESTGKKAPILWEKYEYQFPGFSPYDGFCWIFLYYGRLMGKPMHFPFDEVYLSIILWRKITHTMGKVWIPISQVHLIRSVCCIFLYYEKLMGKPMYFTHGEVYYRIRI